MKKNKQVLDSISKIFELADFSLVNNYFTQRKNAGVKYLNETKEEIEETISEVRDKNAVYLEDELGDIFWNYLQSIKILERDGQIRSTEKVFENCFRKYSERLYITETKENKKWKEKNDLDKASPQWIEVKNKQKNRLKKEHEDLYGKIDFEEK